MSVSPSSIIIILLFLILISLFVVTHHLRSELTKSRQDVVELQAQLDEAIAQRDAERLRIMNAARRLDEALTMFVNNSEEAHEDHEERMDELSNIESPEAVDWLCEPVPDDIRRLLGCETGTSDDTGSEAGSTDGIDAAMH